MSIHANRLVFTAGVLVTMTAAVSAAHARPLPADPRLIRVESALGQAATPRAATPPAGAPAAGRALGGFTRQGWPGVLEISMSAKRIALAVTGLDMRCTSGARFTLEDGWTHLPIQPDGRVQVSKRISPMAGSSVSITGGSHSFIGMLDRKRAIFFGRWHLHLDFLTSDGQTDHCDSGSVPFAARL